MGNTEDAMETMREIIKHQENIIYQQKQIIECLDSIAKKYEVGIIQMLNVFFGKSIDGGRHGQKAVIEKRSANSGTRDYR